MLGDRQIMQAGEIKILFFLAESSRVAPSRSFVFVSHVARLQRRMSSAEFRNSNQPDYRRSEKQMDDQQ